MPTCPLARRLPPERRFHQLIRGGAGAELRERGADALVGVDRLEAEGDERGDGVRGGRGLGGDDGRSSRGRGAGAFESDLP